MQVSSLYALHGHVHQLTACLISLSTLAKKFRKLYPKVQPGSDALHKISTLKEQVREVDELRKAIVGAFGDDCISATLDNHHFLGVRVVLAPVHGPTVAKPMRPELNVEDLTEGP